MTQVRKNTNPTVDKKRSLAAKRGAVTRAQNKELALKKRSLRLHHKIMIGGAGLALLVFAFLGVQNIMSVQAATQNENAFVGLAGKCLDNNRNVRADWNKVQLYDCNGTDAQKWTVEGTEIKAMWSDYCLDVKNGITTAGAVLQLYKCNGTDAQQFTVTNGGIKNVRTGYYVSVSRARTDNDTPLTMHSPLGGVNLSDAQKWSYTTEGPVTMPTQPTPPTTPTNPTVPTVPTQPTTPTTPTTPVGNGTVAPPAVASGYKRGLSLTFDTAAANGKVAQNGSSDNLAYSKYMEPYGEGWNDNFGGTYGFNKQTSVSDGTMKVNVGSVNGVNTGAAWSFINQNTGWGFTYGSTEMRARVTGNLAGYGSAALLWPDTDKWGDGEIDFPEGDFGGNTNIYVHCVGANPQNNCSSADTGFNWKDWHTYKTVWTSSSIKFYVDGKLVHTNTNAVPKTSHHWVVQIGRHGGGAKSTSLSGTFEVDYAVIDTQN